MFEIVYTGVMIPYNTLPVEMTSDFAQRTYLAGSKAMFGKIANFWEPLFLVCLSEFTGRILRHHFSVQDLPMEQS